MTGRFRDGMAPEDADSPLEAYLDRLLLELSDLPPRRLRHMLAEAEAHLRDAAEEAMAHGAGPREAELEAVRRFGAPTAVAGGERRQGALSLPALLRALFTSGLLLAGLGGVAVGLSGLLAALIRVAAGAQFLADSAPGQSFDPSHCGVWLALEPHAVNCHQAAMADWANETVFYRIALGLLGGVALAAFALVRHRWRRSGRWAILPAGLLDTIALCGFGLAGLLACALAVNAAVGAGWHGSGQWLSAALVALPAGAVAGWRLLGDLRAGGPGALFRPA